MDNLKVKPHPEPMPLPRPRSEMNVFEQMLWDQRRIHHAVENRIPLSALTDIKFEKLNFKISPYETMDVIRRRMYK